MKLSEKEFETIEEWVNAHRYSIGESLYHQILGWAWSKREEEGPSNKNWRLLVMAMKELRHYKHVIPLIDHIESLREEGEEGKPRFEIKMRKV